MFSFKLHNAEFILSVASAFSVCCDGTCHVVFSYIFFKLVITRVRHAQGAHIHCFLSYTIFVKVYIPAFPLATRLCFCFDSPRETSAIYLYIYKFYI